MADAVSGVTSPKTTAEAPAMRARLLVICFMDSSLADRDADSHPGNCLVCRGDYPRLMVAYLSPRVMMSRSSPGPR